MQHADDNDDSVNVQEKKTHNSDETSSDIPRTFTMDIPTTHLLIDLEELYGISLPQHPNNPLN